MKGWSSWRQVRRGCMVSAGRSVFWCPLVGAESDSCGRNGRWKGLIFRHNRVHVLNQGAILKKSSLRGVHPGDFPSRQGENERRPISCAHSSWIKRSTLLCRKMTRVHPVVSFPLFLCAVWKKSEREKQQRVDTRRRVAQKLGPAARVILSQTQAFGDGGYSWKRWGAGSGNRSRCHDVVICLYSRDFARWYQHGHRVFNSSTQKNVHLTIPRRAGRQDEIELR